MKGKRLLYMSLVVMLILSVVSVTPLTGEPYTPPSPGTWIHVEPDPSYHYSEAVDLTGTHFNVSVNVFNVTDLAGWEFKLWYNTTLLDAIRVYKTWLTEDNTDWVPWYPTPGVFDPTIGINDTLGRVWYSAIIPILTPFTGSGPFLTIEFEIAMAPPRDYAPPDTLSVSCPLHINETALTKVLWVPPYSEPIEHSLDDGFYEYERGQIEVGGDVAVINVVPSESQAYQAWTIQVNVTVKNNATGTINCTVTAYYNASTWHEIGTQNVTDLAEGTNTTLTFNWNLAGVPYCNHTVKANATLLNLADINLNNNEFVVYDAVKVKMAGDASCDEWVDYEDLGLLAAAYGSHPGDANWNRQCDFNDDSYAGSMDLFILTANYGKSY